MPSFWILLISFTYTLANALFGRAFNIYIYIFYLPRLFDVCVIFWNANTFHPAKIFHFKYLIDPARKKNIHQARNAPVVPIQSQHRYSNSKTLGQNSIWFMCWFFPGVGYDCPFFFCYSCFHTTQWVSEWVNVSDDELFRNWRYFTSTTLIHTYTHTLTHWNRTTSPLATISHDEFITLDTYYLTYYRRNVYINTYICTHRSGPSLLATDKNEMDSHLWKCENWTE